MVIGIGAFPPLYRGDYGYNHDDLQKRWHTLLSLVIVMINHYASCHTLSWFSPCLLNWLVCLLAFTTYLSGQHLLGWTRCWSPAWWRNLSRSAGFLVPAILVPASWTKDFTVNKDIKWRCSSSSAPQHGTTTCPKCRLNTIRYIISKVHYLRELIRLGNRLHE